MTDPQADLTERTRALLRRLRDVDDIVDFPGGAQEIEFGLNEGAAIRTLAAFAQSEREAAAAEARRAAIEECKTIAMQRGEVAKDIQELDWITIAHAADDIVAGIEALASPPAPQEAPAKSLAEKMEEAARKAVPYEGWMKGYGRDE